MLGSREKCWEVTERCDDITESRSGDWSNNPYVARTRDIRAALTFVKNSNLPKHSEHGLGRAMAALGWCDLPFAFFDPSIIAPPFFYL